VAPAPNVPDGFELGSLRLRVIAALFDAFVGALIWYPFFYFWGHYNQTESQYQVAGLPALAMVLATAAYWILTEWFFGATIGKLICDLRVVSLTGKKCSLGQSVKRNLLRVVDFFPFYIIGFLAAKLSPLRQRLGDQWANTIVVRKGRKLLFSDTNETEQPSIQHPA
jgi:uncharacterized RDD family membrane protein YckC